VGKRKIPRPFQPSIWRMSPKVILVGLSGTKLHPAELTDREAASAWARLMAEPHAWQATLDWK
jgi:hypothetical protein